MSGSSREWCFLLSGKPVNGRITSPSDYERGHLYNSRMATDRASKGLATAGSIAMSEAERDWLDRTLATAPDLTQKQLQVVTRVIASI